MRRPRNLKMQLLLWVHERRGSLKILYTNNRLQPSSRLANIIVENSWKMNESNGGSQARASQVGHSRWTTKAGGGNATMEPSLLTDREYKNRFYSTHVPSRIRCISLKTNDGDTFYPSLKEDSRKARI